jgi:hypothetical protein
MSHARGAPRLEFGLTATLHKPRNRIGTNVTIRDISTLGCRLEHAEGAIIGKTCELYFEWQGAYVGLEARVVWKDAEGRIGLKFVRVDDHSQRCLRELCASLHLQARAATRMGDAEAAGSLPDSMETQGAAQSMVPPRAATEPPPRTVPERRHRKLPRYVCELRGHILNLATGVSAEVALVDLSVAGARLEGTGLPDAGQTCQLHAEWEGRQLVVGGEVVWISREQVGMRFSSLDEETAKLVRQICANLNLVPPALHP